MNAIVKKCTSGITVLLSGEGPQGPAGPSLPSAPIITSVLLSDFIPIVRNGVVYLATVANVLAATSPADVFSGEDGITIITGEDGTTPLNQES